MDLHNKKVLVVATTDDMIGRFMIPHIKHMQSLGAEVICACNKCTEFFDMIKESCGCKMYDIYLTRNPFNVKLFKGYKQLKEIVKNEKIDLVNCMQPVGGFMGRMVAKKFHLPCLYTAHGFHFFKGCPIQNKLIYKTIEKHCAKYTTALVTINDEDYAAAQKMKAKNVYKINGIGVDFSVYKADENFNKNEFRKELGLDDGDFVIASVGELNKNKNTLMLLDVFKDLDNKKIKYLVCGRGPLESEFNKKIKEYALEENVKMLGFRHDIPQILNTVDCYIMPSYREGLSKSMMEAMCYGLPVIASKIRGNTDLLGENEGGVLVEPTDKKAFLNAIENMAKDKEKTGT